MDTPERLKQAATEAQAVEVAFNRALKSDEEEELSSIPCVSEVRPLGDKYHLIASDPPCVLRALYPFINQHGLEPISINTYGPSLEDVFVKLVARDKEQRNG